jgi:hypothetical protein
MSRALLLSMVRGFAVAVGLSASVWGAPESEHSVSQEVPAVEEHRINTDRPHNAEAPYVLPRGWIQTESGGLYLRSRGGEQDWSLNLPNLFRVGTGENWEFRVESDTLDISARQGGFNDLSLGFKYLFYEGEVEIALLGRLFLPAGSPGRRAPGPEPDAKLCFCFPISDSLELEWNLGGGLPLDPTTGGRFFRHFVAANLTQELTEHVGIYGELVSLGGEFPGRPSYSHLDAGFLFWASDDLQLDLEYYRGLSSGGIDWGVGFGLSNRW